MMMVMVFCRKRLRIECFINMFLQEKVQGS